MTHPLTDDIIEEISISYLKNCEGVKSNMRTAADWQLEQMIEYIVANDWFAEPKRRIVELRKAMRPLHPNNPVFPTKDQLAEWDSEYFDGERQNFDVMMIKAFQAGADSQLEQVIEWIKECPSYDLDFYSECRRMIADLKDAMRPEQQQEES